MKIIDGLIELVMISVRVAANNPLIYNVLSNASHQSSCIVESPDLTPPTGDVGNGRKSEIP